MITLTVLIRPGAAARGLPAGVHSAILVDAEERIRFRRTVILDADERVELDVRNAINAEVWRGKVPERVDLPAEATPAIVEVVVLERAVRVYVDDRELGYDDATHRYRETLGPGPVTLLATREGRVRSTQTVVIAGQPWRCAANAAGALDCVEVAPLAALETMDAEAWLARLADTAPRLRAQVLLDSQGKTDCATLVRWFASLADDSERVTVARGFRARVTDPWNHGLLTAALSFPDSRREVETWYSTSTPP